MFNFNLFSKKLKKILLSINRTIESFFNNFTLIKKQYSTSKKKLKYIDNRIALVVGLLLILIFTYFLIPTIFNKNETKTILKNQILNKYGINIKFNEKIEYGLFPKPYFYTKGLVIINNNKNLGKSDYAKIYISPKNLFSAKNIKIKNLVFKKTEFRIDSRDVNFFNRLININASNDKVIFINSNLFYENQNQEILFFSKIKKLNFHYDKKKLNQLASLNFEIFNIPFKLKITNISKDKKKIIRLSSKKIRLDIKSIIENEELDFNGLIDVLIYNKSSSLKFEVKKDLIKFISNNEKFKGKINIKPFYFFSELYFNQFNYKKLFNNDSIFMTFVDSQIINNENLNANIMINFDRIESIPYLHNLILKIFFDQGNILIDNSSVKWNDAAKINLNTIQFINNKDGKKLIGEISFDFTDIDKIYSYYQIRRNYRQRIKNIKFDFILDIIQNKFVINNLKVDNNTNKDVNILLENFNFKDENIFNKVRFRNFVKDFFKVYTG